jgi:acetylornithine deacetylase/succinyl-diaminopimelate desuccinylase
MVSIPSYSGMERQEERVAKYIYRYFEKLGIEVSYQHVEEGRPNVIATLPGTGGGASIMLCGHTDTVPPYDMEDPFSGSIEGRISGEGMSGDSEAGIEMDCSHTKSGDNRRIRGRGACDMKGPLAAMMCGVAAIKQSGISHAGDIYFAAVVDEEESAKGVTHLATHGPRADAAIVGEPTDMNICLGQKGLEWIRVLVRGRKVHGGDRENGINAVAMAAHLVHYLETEYASELATRTHPVLGYATINTGTIKGGDQPSTIPDFCEITLDRRYIPGETRESVYCELRAIISRMKELHPGFDAEVKPYFDGIPMLPQSPFCTDANSRLVRCAEDAASGAGLPPRAITAFPAWTDAGTIHEFARSECIIMGPGELSLAHSANESIAISDLAKAANVYAAIALRYSR